MYKPFSTMEQTVRIVSVGELKESTFTTRQGEQKLLVKREFIISNGYDEIACEMLGDKAKMWGQKQVQASMSQYRSSIWLVSIPPLLRMFWRSGCMK